MQATESHLVDGVRSWYRVLIILTLFLAIFSPTGSMTAQRRASSVPFDVETFTGPDFVDLWWDPATMPGCVTMKIYRSGVEVADLACAVGVLTDTGLTAGVAVSYWLDGFDGSDPPLKLYTQSVSATPGIVGGNLRRSLSLSGALTLGGVNVGDDGQLTLNNVTAVGGTVRDWIDGGGGTVAEQGSVSVSGGTFNGTTFGLKNPSSSLTGLTLTNGGQISTPGSVADVTLSASVVGLEGSGSVSLSGSTLTDTVVAVTGSVAADIGNNTFSGGHLQIGGTATADVYASSFTNSSLRIWEEADVSADGNHFGGTIPSARAFIDVTSVAGVALNGNVLTVDGNEGSRPAILIWPDGAPIEGAVYALTSNALRGDDGASDGIRVTGDTAGSAINVAISNNTIGRFDQGVAFSDQLVSGQVITATLSGNTISGNVYGIIPGYDGSGNSLTAHNNCIASNVYGIYCTNEDFVIDATSNYWGHPDGPTHTTNPDGLGDRIWCSDSASEIDFDPWLTSHACGVNDLAIANIEVVQTVQTISNTVPLVAGKATVVRVYPDVGIGFATVDGTLTGSRDGQALGTLEARAPIGAGSVTDWDVTRLDEDASLIFDLPEAWLDGVVTLRADVSPVAQVANCSSDVAPTASLTATATFHERRPVTFAYIPASVDALTRYLPVTPKEILAVHDRIMARFPFGEARVRILPDADRYAPNLTGIASGMQWTYLSAVARRWELLNNPAGAADYYITVYGTENTDYTGSWWFFGVPNGRGACGLRLDGYDCVATVGNQLGLRPLVIDDETAEPPFDYVFPYSDHRTHVLGYDILSGEVQSPELYDLMAPEAMDDAPNWISDYHYEKAYLNLTPAAPVQRAAADAADSADGADYLYITGYAGPGGGSFHPVIHLANSPAPDDVNPVDPAGDYCVQAWDWSGKIAESCFDLDLTNVDTGAEDALTPFTVALVDSPGIRQLLLRYQGNTLARLEVPSSPPDITLVSVGYEADYKMARIAWTTPLADHRNQRYHVHYSPDNGASWIPVGIDIDPDRINYVDGAYRWGVRADQVPSGNQAKLRLIASDGYNETTVTSAAFTMPDVGPWVDILTPANHAVIAGFPVTFEGYAYDVTAGDRTAAVTWTSDRDGLLGSGDGLSVMSLSAGVHIVTLAADDGDGHVATDTVRLTVEGEVTATDWVYLPLVLR